MLAITSRRASGDLLDDSANLENRSSVTQKILQQLPLWSRDVARWR
jgi:hypothetical protein